MRFAAFGRTQLLYDSILSCVESGHQPVMIGTAKHAPEYSKTREDFEKLAKHLGCPFFDDFRFDNQLSRMVEANAEVAISVNWPGLISQRALELFPHGILNAHAGALPRFRGNACPNWAIISGEKEVAITIHKMAEELDAGPILVQRRIALTDETYIGDVYKQLECIVPQMFSEAVEGLQTGRVRAVPQSNDPSSALRCFSRRPSDAFIDWNQSAISIARLVRASAEPFAGAFTFLDGERLIVWRAKPDQLPYEYMGCNGHVAEVKVDSGNIFVLTGDGVLNISEIEIPGKFRGPPTKIIASTRLRLGLDLVAEIERLKARL